MWRTGEPRDPFTDGRGRLMWWLPVRTVQGRGLISSPSRVGGRNGRRNTRTPTRPKVGIVGKEVGDDALWIHLHRTPTPGPRSLPEEPRGRISSVHTGDT